MKRKQPPGSIDELAALLKAAHDQRAPAGPITLQGLNRLVAHVPEDMTATVETGLTLGALQAALAGRGQWLPLDPPGADKLTLRELLDDNLSGPRRFGFGTARDWLIGLTAVLANGDVITSGAKVVKNVAGYDLHKLLIGARGELAVIVEATFKLAPLPEAQRVLAAGCDSLEQAAERIAALLALPVSPTVLDLHSPGKRLELVIGFSGTAREVEWQCEQVGAIAPWKEGSLNYSDRFFGKNGPVETLSVLPSRLVETLAQIGSGPFVARAGNGVIYHRPETPAPPREPSPLEERVREMFDPHGVLKREKEEG